MAGSRGARLQRPRLHPGAAAGDPAAHGGARGPGAGAHVRAEAGEGAGRVRGEAGGEQVPGRGRLHARRPLPPPGNQVPCGRSKDGTPRRGQGERQGVVGDHLRPPGLEEAHEDRRV